MTPLCVSIAGEPSSPPVRGATTGTTAPTACAASIWTSPPATGRRTAADCGGLMEPIAVWVRKNGEWAIIHRCKSCGALSSNRIAADDNPIKLMSLAMKPVSSPPFPLERIEEMTKAMGGEGEIVW